MASVTNLTIEYNRYYAKGLICLAREDWSGAVRNLEIAARKLCDIAAARKGDAKEYTQVWLFDLIADIKQIDIKIQNDKTKGKVMKMISEMDGQKKKEHIVEASGVPSTTFDEIAGLDDVKSSVMYKVIYPRKHPDLYETFKKRTGGGILLFGLPGTGKTMIAEAIAHETGASFFPVKCSDIGSKWFGETEQNIRDIFDAARAAENAVIFFDEIEAYATNRRDSGAMERSVPEFLAQMHGVGESNNKNRLLVIGATNKPWMLDGAFLRPGRFDEKIYVPLPDAAARKLMIERRIDGVPCKLDNLDGLVSKTEGYNGADVDYLCEKAKEFAIKRAITDENAPRTLLMVDFENAFATLKSSVLPAEKIEMELWAREYGV